LFLRSWTSKGPALRGFPHPNMVRTHPSSPHYLLDLSLLPDIFCHLRPLLPLQAKIHCREPRWERSPPASPQGKRQAHGCPGAGIIAQKLWPPPRGTSGSAPPQLCLPLPFPERALPGETREQERFQEEQGLREDPHHTGQGPAPGSTAPPSSPRLRSCHTWDLPTHKGGSLLPPPSPKPQCCACRPTACGRSRGPVL